WLRGPLFGWVPREGDSFESSFGYSFFGTYYNDLTSFNITDHMVNASFAYRTVLFNMPAQFALSYAWDMLYLREAGFLSWNPVPHLRLSYGFAVHVRDYGNKNSLPPTPDPGSKWRQDQEYNHTVRAEAPFEGPRILGEPTRMSLALAYQNTVANSNIAVF